MKKKRILSVCFIIIGIMLISVGSVLFITKEKSLTNSTVTPNEDNVKDEDSDKDVQEDSNVNEDPYELNRDYKTVNDVLDAQVDVIEEQEFSNVTSEIGFSDNKCLNSSCVASKKPYNGDVEDLIIVNYVDDEVYSIGTFMYYYEDDYKLEVVVSDTNELINNYIGYSYTIEYFQKLQNMLDGVLMNNVPDDDVVFDRIYVGEYTLETILGKSDEFYMIKTFLIKTFLPLYYYFL